MNVRSGLAALFVAAGLLTATACGSQQAGTPVLPGITPVAAGTESTSAAVSSAGTDSDATANPTTSGPTESSEPTESTEPTEATGTDAPSSSEDSSQSSDPGTGAVNLDATTQQWMTGMCTDMGALLGTMFDMPKVTEKAPLSEYQPAWVAYYTGVANAAGTSLEHASAGMPPHVPNGAKIHQAFLRFLTGLQDITGNGVALMQSRTSVADVAADIQQINKEIENLSNSDYGLSNIKSPELESAMRSVPACKNIISQG